MGGWAEGPSRATVLPQSSSMEEVRRWVIGGGKGRSYAILIESIPYTLIKFKQSQWTLFLNLHSN